MVYLDSNAGNAGNSRGLFSKTIEFAEVAAGVYTGTVQLPATASLVDIIVDGAALWAAGTSATMIVGDVTDPDGYFTAVNLKATDLLAGESISFALAGGKAGAYIANSQVTPRRTAAARNIIGQVTQVGAGATGLTYMTVIWADATSLDADNAVFVAA